MKYDELIDKLRGCSNYHCKDCELNDKRDCCAFLMKKAADAIEELQKALDAVNDAHNEGYHVGCWAGRRDYEPKCIHVSERLPKLGEMVAVYMHSAIHGDEVKIDRMVISNTTDIPYWSFYKGRVKAWMPLPEPPKEETDG